MRGRRAFSYLWAVGLGLTSVSLLTVTTPVEAATAPPPPSPFVLGCPDVTPCPSFVDSGKSIQVHPRIYLLFWGPAWGTAPLSGQVNKVIKFFQLLPGSDWQQGLHNFSGKNGRFKGLTYGGAVL